MTGGGKPIKGKLNRIVTSTKVFFFAHLLS